MASSSSSPSSLTPTWAAATTSALAILLALLSLVRAEDATATATIATTIDLNLPPLSATVVPPAPGGHGYGLLGCFVDFSTGHAGSGLGGQVLWSRGSVALTADSCLDACESSVPIPSPSSSQTASIPYYPYASVSNGTTCFCGLDISPDLVSIDWAYCAIPCTGDSTVACGGNGCILIYSAAALTETSISSFVSSFASTASATSYDLSALANFPSTSAAPAPTSTLANSTNTLLPANQSAVTDTSSRPVVAIILTVIFTVLLLLSLFVLCSRYKHHVARPSASSTTSNRKSGFSHASFPSRVLNLFAPAAARSRSRVRDPEAEMVDLSLHPPRQSPRRLVDWARLDSPIAGATFSPSFSSSRRPSAMSTGSNPTDAVLTPTRRRPNVRVPDESAKAHFVLGLDSARDWHHRRYSTPYPPVGTVANHRRSSLQGDYAGVRIGPPAPAADAGPSPVPNSLPSSPVQTLPPQPDILVCPRRDIDDSVRFFVPRWDDASVGPDPTTPACFIWTIDRPS